MKGQHRFLPCEPRGPLRYGCRHWASLNWWAWAGLTWEDYLWATYGVAEGIP